MRLSKAYHLGTPGLRRAEARGILLLAATIFALAAATGGARLDEIGLSVQAAQAAAAPLYASRNQQVMAAVARSNETDSPLDGKQPAIRAQMAELLRLANELQNDVDKTNKDTLALSVVRKADEIEKLARLMKAERPEHGYGDH